MLISFFANHLVATPFGIIRVAPYLLHRPWFKMLPPLPPSESPDVMNVDPNYVVHGRGQLLTERSGGGGADTPLYMSYILVRVLHCRLILCLLVSRRCWRCNRISIIVKFWLTLVVFPLTLGGFSTLNVVSHLRFDFSAFVDYSPSFITIESGNTMDSNAQTPPR